MKILSSAQIRACDEYTIRETRIRSLDLMERAANKCVEWIISSFSKDTLFVILCGGGNNGGDGFAIARLLHRRGFGVKAFLVKNNSLSKDCDYNYQQLLHINPDLVGSIEPGRYITDIPGDIVIIDAILGTGLSRPITGWLETFVQHVNALPNRKIAIDIPSGLAADTLPAEGDTIVNVSDTLSFQFFKRSFLHPESASYTGNVNILDIGLSQTFINEIHSQYTTITRQDITKIYRPRQRFAHKGTYGHAWIAGGHYGKMGAMVLSSIAALRAGAGLVTAHIPSCGYTILQTAVPEAMCTTSGEQAICDFSGWQQASAIAVGPGLGTDSETTDALGSFLESCNTPVIIDADALNIISLRPEFLARIPKGSILTPHPKEFSRLFGHNTNSMVQVDNARIQAMRYGLNIVLKGHHTAVIDSDGNCRYNMTGNAGMATGGSGDVLTGILAGLLAQGYSPRDAAIMGVYLHGLAGDLAASDKSQESLIASDIVEHLGEAYLSI
ncbi:MAG: NAD(P)H-hydrate dehydratase [Taibaiella sp.]|nr:NAD(P)H-hydrate dehydratase [Taibaiella sp.]